MARDGRLSATMVWLICIAASPSGFWHKSQAKLPHLHEKKNKHLMLHDLWKCPKVACWDSISTRGIRGNICFFILWFTHLIEMSEGKGGNVLGWRQDVSWYGWEWLGGQAGGEATVWESERYNGGSLHWYTTIGSGRVWRGGPLLFLHKWNGDYNNPGPRNVSDWLIG